jgi:hypothetical protein
MLFVVFSFSSINYLNIKRIKVVYIMLKRRRIDEFKNIENENIKKKRRRIL